MSYGIGIGSVFLFYKGRTDSNHYSSERGSVEGIKACIRGAFSYHGGHFDGVMVNRRIIDKNPVGIESGLNHS